MLRKTWLLAIALLAIGCTKTVVSNPPAPTPNPDHTVTLSWSQSEADSPLCSASVTSSCLSGYSEGTVNGATFTSLHTDTMAVCTGTTEPLPCITTFQTASLAIGNVTFGIVLNYVDQTGTAKSLAAVTTSTPTVVSADAPQNVTATVGP